MSTTRGFRRYPGHLRRLRLRLRPRLRLRLRLHHHLRHLHLHPPPPPPPPPLPPPVRCHVPRVVGLKLDHGEDEDPQGALLSRPRPARSLEASRPRDRPEPATGRVQATRIPGQARRRPALRGHPDPGKTRRMDCVSESMGRISSRPSNRRPGSGQAVRKGRHAKSTDLLGADHRTRFARSRCRRRVGAAEREQQRADREQDLRAQARCGARQGAGAIEKLGSFTSQARHLTDNLAALLTSSRPDQRNQVPDPADLERGALRERVRPTRPLPAHDAARGLQLRGDGHQPGL